MELLSHIGEDQGQEEWCNSHFTKLQFHQRTENKQKANKQKHPTGNLRVKETNRKPTSRSSLAPISKLTSQLQHFPFMYFPHRCLRGYLQMIFICCFSLKYNHTGQKIPARCTSELYPIQGSKKAEMKRFFIAVWEPESNSSMPALMNWALIVTWGQRSG